MANAAQWGSRLVRELSLNGVEGSVAVRRLKRRMRQEFTEQIDELEAELATAGLRPNDKLRHSGEADDRSKEGA